MAPTDMREKKIPLTNSLIMRLLAISGNSTPHKINTIPNRKKPIKITEVAKLRCIKSPIDNAILSL
jgi:hypothetical protein